MQLEKTLVPMLVTLSGTVIVVMAHSLKALLPMLVRVECRVISARLLQSAKVPAAILLTALGIFTLSMLSQS